ncbi:MAG: phosphoenolpyruvate carboxykinase (GTP), partial [Gammaproteobacteria bacterium]
MSNHKKLTEWVSQMAELCQPDQVVWCDGSENEYNAMWELLIQGGTATKLNENLRPNSYLVRSDPKDVARVEDRTFICSENEDDAGPTNHWMAPEKMRETLNEVYKDCMCGRTMY